MGENATTCPACHGSGLVPLGNRQWDDCERCLDADEKAIQGARCGCRGQDDYCPCQNAPDRMTLKARNEAIARAEAALSAV